MSTKQLINIDEIRTAVASVDDPEYPGLSITDLGLVETCEMNDDGEVTIELVPTFTGCPALNVIADDVRHAVDKIDGVSSTNVRWLLSPIWTTERISDLGKAILAERFTVAVQIGPKASGCPRCGGPLTDESMFGPSRCRSVSRCTNCVETVEVMRA